MMIHPQRRITKRLICKRKKKTTSSTTTPTPTTTTTTTTTTLPCLPHDIIFFQILPKLPVRCLLTFNCVSKLWYNTIRDPNFHASHLTHAKANPSLVAILYSQPTYFICFLHLEEGGGGHHHHPNSNNNNNNIASLELKSGATNIAGTCNGLTCNVLSSVHIQISNPSTRELLNLSYPKPTTAMPGIVCRGFGFDPLSNEYKVIHIWLDYRKYCECMVYTLGANKWRIITATCNCPPSCFPIDLAPICINGTLFWRTNRNNRILSFDLHHEKFQVITCPQVPQGSICHTLFELRGCLCLVYRRDDNLKDEVQLTLYTLKDHHLLRLLLTKQQQHEEVSSGARWIRSGCYTHLLLKPDIKFIQFVEFARHTYLHWVTTDGHFILYDINSERVTHKKLMGVYTNQWVILVNHVENLLSLKTFVPSSAGEVEVKYVSSREAKHESPDHQQWEVQRKKRIKLVFNSHGYLTNPVQVMNLLKTLVMKILGEREHSSSEVRSSSLCLESSSNKGNPSSSNSNTEACKGFFS